MGIFKCIQSTSETIHPFQDFIINNTQTSTSTTLKHSGHTPQYSTAHFPMKLDASYLHFISQQQLRVLTAIQLGMKNHEWVPSQVIVQIAKLRGGQAFKVIRKLLKNKFIVHTGKKYDGYKLAYLGYDYLVLQTFIKRGIIKDVITKIGVGKQSDIYKCITPQGNYVVLKLTRLGRTSFRSVKKNRQYIGNRTNYNWLYLSRLSSVREFLFMQLLYQNGFPTPKPIDTNRHGIVMSLIQGGPLCHIQRISTQQQIKELFEESLKILVKFAENGLIHGDFNEFNLICDDNCEKLTVIDFPQCVSVCHPNAKKLFDRDVECIYRYFDKMAERTQSHNTVVAFNEKMEKQGDIINHYGGDMSKMHQQEIITKKKFVLDVSQYPMPELKNITVLKRLDKELKTKGHISLTQERQLESIYEENKELNYELLEQTDMLNLGEEGLRKESENSDSEENLSEEGQNESSEDQENEQEEAEAEAEENENLQFDNLQKIKNLEESSGFNPNHDKNDKEEYDEELQNLMKELDHNNLQAGFSEENNIPFQLDQKAQNLTESNEEQEEEREQFKGLTAYQIRQKIKAEKKEERQRKKKLMSEDDYIKNAVKRSKKKNPTKKIGVGNKGHKKRDKANSQAVKEGYEFM